MKRNIFPIMALALVCLFSACDDDLERLPKDELTVPTTFTTYENIQTYAWQFYGIFGNYHRGLIDRDEYSGDLMMNGKNPNGDEWLWKRITVPTSSGLYNENYKRIRAINLMLDNLENSSLNEKDAEHWKAVGLFFRSYHYFELLKAYGGVPWIDKYIDDSDKDYLYGPRASRDELAKHILDDLKWAESKIKKDGDGPNSINTNVVRAMISRFALFEGTWRKYHGLGGEKEYLQACADYSKKLMDDAPQMHGSYDEIYNSPNLAGMPGIILYKQYEPDQHVHNTTQWNRSSEAIRWDLTKKAADMFLCTDGKTRWNSPLFDGDKNPYDEFRNRDRRMYYIITPPYEVVGRVDGNKRKWKHTDNSAHREYIDLMEKLSGEKFKRLPENNWTGFIQPIMPNYRDAGSQKLPFDPGYNVTGTGYKCWKWYNNHQVSIAWKDFTDQPLFRIGEVLLNYAEAKYELGQFDQSVADKTVNRLRVRGEVASMAVAQINANFDPKRNAKVDPVLWEIRRERAVELMCDGFRFDDLRRWKMMNDEAAKEKLGRYIVGAEFNNKLPIQGGKAEGYISRIGVPPAFPDHYYLHPIPSNQIVLNEKLTQNPGW
ncbi:starch-binding protein [Fulvitalea axinellae]|uniref:Starch-binding protein n=1 Tax=Fulvitalea axinellae TaxID=1182444 RepID=A0AAU9DAT3_9BACT|nr:starch-binding protein [Fulvitalea axinellae]